MARRLFRGRSFSENGWPYVDQGSCTWVRVPGAEHVSLQIQNGAPLQILRAFAADYHAYVEPLRDPDSACWTPDNSVATSNHPGGTSMDLNWNGPDGRTFRLGIPKERAFPGQSGRALDEVYAFYESIMFCGGEWSIQDWMHHQLRAGTYDQKNDRPTDKVNDFIRRKIRPDGFSTFRRGGQTAPPVPPAGGNAVDVLARATGVTPQRATEILPGVLNGLRDSKCDNTNRIAMWLAQMGHESAGFKATEEYASGAAYEGRTDLGNTQPGDGVRFKGRTWTQITGRHNYTELSKWAFSKGIVTSPTYFVDNPTRLAEMQYAGLGPAWYWTVARPDINELSDRRDLVTVTRRINGGTNGLPDRQARYDRALALGDQLLALTAQPAPTAPDPWEELMATKVKSLSIYATPGEGPIEVSTMIAALDAHGPHEPYVEARAAEGDPDSIRRIARTAAGLGEYRHAAAINQARGVLTRLYASIPDQVTAALGKATP